MQMAQKRLRTAVSSHVKPLWALRLGDRELRRVGVQLAVDLLLAGPWRAEEGGPREGDLKALLEGFTAMKQLQPLLLSIENMASRCLSPIVD